MTALNSVDTGAAKRIFRPWSRRHEREHKLESEEDDPQLIISIPFT